MSHIIEQIRNAPYLLQATTGIAGLIAFFVGVAGIAIGLSIFFAALRRDKYEDQQSRKGVRL